MSVLIKGMKMPRYCAECDAVNDEELLCPFTNDDCENYFRVRNRNCPIVPVPPHGRLIDENDVRRLFDETDLRARGIYPNNVVALAPTIIPEEGEQ